ncbi:MAG: DUF3782 domain-containing protein [Candidatus Heimdallarchaeota archaeon]
MSGETLEELIRRLPELLKERPELAEKLYEVLKDRFVTNETLKAYMKQSDRHFEELLGQMNRRFEATDKRLEELRVDMNRRFEATDKRFEATDKRLEELRVDMNRRFEELLGQMNRRFEAWERYFESIERRLDIIDAGLGALGHRSGIALERTILNVFRRALELRGIDVDKVEKMGIRDDRGDLYHPGAKIEYDLYVHDEEHILFEIKYRITEQDLENFLVKTKFFEQKKGIRPQKVVITLEIEEYVKRLCADRGIEVITR